MNKYENASLAQNQIKQMIDSLELHYQNTRIERGKLALWEESKDFTILGEIEVLEVDISGYAYQVAEKGYVIKPLDAIALLQDRRIFDIPFFAAWYFSPDHHYLELKYYVERYDYLRLLLREYIRLYQLKEENKNGRFIVVAENKDRLSHNNIIGFD